MIFNTHLPEGEIESFIESIFHYKDLIPEHSIERVVPTGHIYIIFELDSLARNTFDNETLEPKGTFTRVWVSGMHRNYISISTHKNSEMFVVQFKAFGALPFLHVPLEEINEKVIPAEKLFGDEIFMLRDKLMAVESHQEKFTIAEEWLNERYDKKKSPPAELLSIVTKLKNEPASNFDKIVETYPNTHKHLIDQFKKYVGLTPKYYQRILRFNELLQQINQKEKLTWAQIAHQSGYSDQPHFIKEFKHFSGFNPQEFIDEGLTSREGNFFPLDK